MSRADGTPFTIAPLDAIIPPWSPSPVNDDILDGTYQTPTHCTNEIKALFKALMYKDRAQPTILNIKLTIEQWTASIIRNVG